MVIVGKVDEEMYLSGVKRWKQNKSAIGSAQISAQRVGVVMHCWLFQCVKKRGNQELEPNYLLNL